MAATAPPAIVVIGQGGERARPRPPGEHQQVQHGERQVEEAGLDGGLLGVGAPERGDEEQGDQGRERDVQRRRALGRRPLDAPADPAPGEGGEPEDDDRVERHQQVGLLAAERDRRADRQGDAEQDEPHRRAREHDAHADDHQDGRDDRSDDGGAAGDRRGEAVEAVAPVVLRDQRAQQDGPGRDQHGERGRALRLAAQARQRQQQSEHGERGRDGRDVAGGLAHRDASSGISAAPSPSSVRATSQSAEGVMPGGTRTRARPSGPRAPPPTWAPSGSPRVSPGTPVRR